MQQKHDAEEERSKPYISLHSCKVNSVHKCRGPLPRWIYQQDAWSSLIDPGRHFDFDKAGKAQVAAIHLGKPVPGLWHCACSLTDMAHLSKLNSNVLSKIVRNICLRRRSHWDMSLKMRSLQNHCFLFGTHPSLLKCLRVFWRCLKFLTQGSALHWSWKSHAEHVAQGLQVNWAVLPNVDSVVKADASVAWFLWKTESTAIYHDHWC